MDYIFEVGKTYETVDAFGYKATTKVIARSTDFIITKYSYGDRKESYPLWNGENARPVTLVKCTTKTIDNGVEKTTVHYVEKTIDCSFLGEISADKEVKMKEEPKELICFEVGKNYLDNSGDKFTCRAIIKKKSEKVGIFYNETYDVVDEYTIENKNNVEYTYFVDFPESIDHIVDFIADEKYRDEIQALL